MIWSYVQDFFRKYAMIVVPFITMTQGMIMASDNFTNRMYYLLVFHCFDALHGMVSEKLWND